MAKKQDKDLLRKLRAGGVRKKVARLLTDATGSGKQGKQATLVTKTLDNLKAATDELDKRARGSERSAAAKKGAHPQAEGSTAERSCPQGRTDAREGPLSTQVPSIPTHHGPTRSAERPAGSGYRDPA